MQNLKTITVNAVTLPQVTYKGQPVVTAKAIAAIHKTTIEHVQRAYANNAGHFTEGRDYFKLSKEEAQALGFDYASTRLDNIKLCPLFRYSSTGMVLFTRAGYLMLTKTFRDNLSWDIQRKLVDAYFTLEVAIKRPIALAGITLKDAPALPDGDHLRTAMALPVNRMATLEESTGGAVQKSRALLHGLQAELRKLEASATHSGELERANSKLAASLEAAWGDLKDARRKVRELEARNIELEAEIEALKSIEVDLTTFNKIKDLLAR